MKVNSVPRAKVCCAPLPQYHSIITLMLVIVLFFVFALAAPFTLNGQQKAAKRAAVVEATEEKPADDKDDKKSKKKKAETDVLKQKGPIQEIAKPLDDLIDLSWRDGKLSIDMKKTYEEVDPINDKIRELVGWGGGSSHNGSNGFSFELASEKITGHIRRSKKNKVFTNSVLLNEITKPYRTMQLTVNDDGLLRVTINASRTAYLLRIRQLPEGRFMVQELNGTKVFAGSASDFDTFCREYRDFSADRLLPMLKHFSLGQVLTPYSPEIQKKVTELVSPWKPGDLEKVRTLTAALDSEVYEEREAASSELEKVYKGNESLLARMVHDSSFHPEARSRARKLIREKIDEDKLSELDFIDRVASSLDAEYLVDLIQLQSDTASREVLVQRLRDLAPDLTDKNIRNADVVSLVASQAINAWASDQVGAGDGEPAIDVMGEKGHFQKISEHTGKLVKLIWHEDSLKVDRDHWKEPFGGRKIEDLSKEIKELVKKHNLPDDWYNGGGPQYSEKSAKHSQVLFDKLREQCGGQTENVHHYSYGRGYAGASTPNRQFDKSKMKGELTFDKKARNASRRGRSNSSSGGSLARKPFVLELTEKSGPQRALLIDEEKPGQLRIMITGDSSNYIIQLILGKDEALVQDIRGSQVQALKAKNFRELQTENEAYFRDSFFPLMRHLGVLIDPAIDAGAKGNETTMIERGNTTQSSMTLK